MFLFIVWGWFCWCLTTHLDSCNLWRPSGAHLCHIWEQWLWLLGQKHPKKSLLTLVLFSQPFLDPALVRSVPLCISLHILESPCKLSVSSWKPLLPSSFLNPRFLKAQWNFFFLLASGCYVFPLLFTLQEGFYFATSSGFTVSKNTVPQYNTVPCVFSTYF